MASLFFCRVHQEEKMNRPQKLNGRPAKEQESHSGEEVAMSVYGERRGQATEISSPNIFVGRHIFLDHCVAEKKMISLREHRLDSAEKTTGGRVHGSCCNESSVATVERGERVL